MLGGYGAEKQRGTFDEPDTVTLPRTVIRAPYGYSNRQRIRIYEKGCLAIALIQWAEKGPIQHHQRRPSTNIGSSCRVDRS